MHSPLPAPTPATPTALAELVHLCRSRGLPLVDYGVAHAGLGRPPPAERFDLRLVPAPEHPEGLIDHQVRDFTVRASSAAALGPLQASLALHGQWLPLDADDDLTLGEVISHGVFGPLRCGMGSLRDHTLGLAFIDGQGKEVRAGGQTVKNVAGYDLSRFLWGSLGEMGLILDATLRTFARPEAARSAALRLQDPAALDPHVTPLLLSDAAPTHLELMREPEGWRLTLGWLGDDRETRTRSAALDAWAREAGLPAPQSEPAIPLAQDEARRAGSRAWRRSAAAWVRVVVPPGVTGQACALLAQAAAAERSLRINALPVHGCIHAGGDLSPDLARALDRAARAAADSLGGCVVWHRRPPKASASLEPFHPLPPEWPVLQRIKRALDPHAIFNPGRMIPLSPTTPRADPCDKESD
jgi:glycolate oxidase FAD binding subunit